MAVAWSTAYLATILEDEWIELPPRIADELTLFGINAFWDPDSFSMYLKNKLDAVVRFVLALEVTLDYERKCRPKTLKKLMSVEGLEDYLPKFPKVVRSIRRDFEALAADLSQQHAEELRGKLERLLKAEVTYREIEAIRQQLEPLYDYVISS
jgi:hypothetical protein